MLRCCALVFVLCLAMLAARDHSSSNRHQPHMDLERAACRHHAAMCIDGLKFTDLYSSLFHSRRNGIHNVVQIGVGHGESVKVWHDYFSNANIYGFANNARLGNSTLKTLLKSTSSRLKLHVDRNVSFISILEASKLKRGSVDVIFESGCNGLGSCHEKVLILMFPFLRPGGHYMMEGVNLRSGNGGGDFFLGGIGTGISGVLSAGTREIFASNHPFFVDASIGHKSLWKRYYNNNISSSTNNGNINSYGNGHKANRNASDYIEFDDHSKHNLFLLAVRRRVGSPSPVEIQTGWTYLNKAKVVLAPLTNNGGNLSLTLEGLAFAAGTHKSKDDHKYTDFYGSLLQPLRHKHLQMAEVGVGVGQSLLLWREYFTSATIHGFDNDKSALAFVASKLPRLLANGTEAIGSNNSSSGSSSSSSRVVLVEADSTDSAAMRARVALLHRALDLVIDDGCASLLCQERTLAQLWAAVKPGGHYIIENVRGAAFAASPASLNETTLDILMNNHVFLVNTALGHRSWDRWADVNREAAGGEHDSYLLVVRKRAGHHSSAHHIK